MSLLVLRYSNVVVPQRIFACVRVTRVRGKKTAPRWSNLPRILAEIDKTMRLIDFKKVYDALLLVKRISSEFFRKLEPYAPCVLHAALRLGFKRNCNFS